MRDTVDSLRLRRTAMNWSSTFSGAFPSCADGDTFPCNFWMRDMVHFGVY